MPEFSDSHDAWLSLQELEREILKISEWVEEQKKDRKNNKSIEKTVQNVSTVATSLTNAILKMKSGEVSDIVGGSMDIVSSVVTLVGEAVGGPIGAVVGTIIGTISNIIGAIFTANKPMRPSVVENQAKVVHQELVGFNKKLLDQRYNGLLDRLSEQKTQLRTMKRGDDLADPSLWHDYVQFLGELSSRFQSPLPFKYENCLTKDPDVADFVTALKTYCTAYNCLMAFLISAKGRFSHLKEERSRTKMVDLIIKSQIEIGKMKLAFLSDEKYLTFLGSFPYEGGKLTKIVALSRDSEARSKLESVTRGLGLPRFPDFETVELKAERVSGLSVKVPVPFQKEFISRYSVKFINYTNFPMKVVCKPAGNCSNNRKFIEVVYPRQSLQRKFNTPLPLPIIKVEGYILLHLDGNVNEDENPRSADETRVIEFALSRSLGEKGKINIQDKTDSEFTKGQDTFDKMQDGEKMTIYWSTNDTHYMACGEIFFEPFHGLCLWQFIVNDYDRSQL